MVEDGSTLGSAEILMMSGAWPPPEPSVWNEWTARPSKAAIVSSTKPDSLSVSVWMHTCTSISSATVSAERSTAGVVPQSSWHLKPTAPASICSTSAALPCPWPLPRMPTLIGQPSKARSIVRMLPGPGVTVVALEPSDGPVPPPIRVVVPLDSAAYACCGEMKWMCVSMPAAVRIRCEPEIASVARPHSRPG